MRAIVQVHYGSAADLRLREVAAPVPAEHEVLVRMRAASVHADVWHMVAGRPYVLRLLGAGLRRPQAADTGHRRGRHGRRRGLGGDSLPAGDEVFGETIRGHQWQNGGAFAELVRAPEDALAHKPANVGFEQAAASATSGLIAHEGLRDGGLRAGLRVLVNGAAGAVGAIAVQLAKAAGARVTGVDLGERVELVRGLGADEVIDGARVDFTRRDERYDLILDVPGNRPLAACRRVLDRDGIYVLIGHDHFGAGSGQILGSLPRMLKLVALSPSLTSYPPRAAHARRKPSRWTCSATRSPPGSSRP